MSGSSFAVSWLTPAGSPCAGRLGVDRAGLTLSGASGGRVVREQIPLDEIDEVRIRRGDLEVKKRDGVSVTIGSLDAPGALREAADRLVRWIGRS